MSWPDALVAVAGIAAAAYALPKLADAFFRWFSE